MEGKKSFLPLTVGVTSYSSLGLGMEAEAEDHFKGALLLLSITANWSKFQHLFKKNKKKIPGPAQTLPTRVVGGSSVVKKLQKCISGSQRAGFCGGGLRVLLLF